VPEYWIVDVDGRAIDVYREPGPDGYRAVTRCGPDGRVIPVAFPDLVIPVVDLFT
jgi:Uma2 family endonuclease